MAYSQLRVLVNIIARVFFRQVDTVGAFHIPKEGPVIFVANHANQFVDPMMLIMNIPRVVRFLIAAKSLRRAIIGDLARAALAIGVERPQDLAKNGTGTVSAALGSTTLIGAGTTFTKDLTEGAMVKIGEHELKIKTVENDSSCTVGTCLAAFAEASYKIFPKVDQNGVYFQVHEALKAGDCIGIFPEGGSHDQMQMLELKPGVAIMALGAMQAGAGPVQICPCGLNYFEPYRFRSRVVVEFADPITVPPELVEQYKTDKRGAVQTLMNTVEQAMKRVMPGAKDYEEMQAIVTMRALWKPRNRKISIEENLKITRTFAKGIQMLRKDPRVGQTVLEVQEYNDALQAAGCKDRDVRMNLLSNKVVAQHMLLAVVEVLVLAPFALVFYLLFAPVAAVTYVAAIREKKTALAGSNVKVKALDVVASKKIMVALVLVPCYQTVLSFVVIWCTRRGLKELVFLSLVAWPCLTLLGSRLCDRFQKALIHCRTNFSGRKSKPLLVRRAELQTKIRALVEEFGPKVVDDWTGKRIISADELARDNDMLQDLLQPLLGRGGGSNPSLSPKR